MLLLILVFNIFLWTYDYLIASFNLSGFQENLFEQKNYAVTTLKTTVKK